MKWFKSESNERINLSTIQSITAEEYQDNATWERLINFYANSGGKKYLIAQVHKARKEEFDIEIFLDTIISEIDKAKEGCTIDFRKVFPEIYQCDADVVINIEKSRDFNR